MPYLLRLPLFLLGGRRSIEILAGLRRAWLPGVLLVLTAGIARNYDHNFLPQNLRWLGVPLLASAFSSVFVFWIARWLLRPGKKAREKAGLAPQEDRAIWSLEFPGIYACFLATAPMAWLYAIPVEAHLTYLEAAKANLWLLGIVSLWRVFLIARVFQVLAKVPFYAALCAVLFPCAIEALVASFLAAVGTIDVAAGMGGLAQGPKEQLMGNVYGTVVMASLCLLPICAGAIFMWRSSRQEQCVRDWQGLSIDPSEGRAAWWPSALLLALAAVFVIPMQRKMREHQIAEALPLPAGDWMDYGGPRAVEPEEKGPDPDSRTLLDHLATRSPDDFYAPRLLPPATWKDGVREIAPVLANLREDDPPWLLLHYLEHACILRARGGGFYTEQNPDGTRLARPIPALMHLYAITGPEVGLGQELEPAEKARLQAMRAFLKNPEDPEHRSWAERERPEWLIAWNRVSWKPKWD